MLIATFEAATGWAGKRITRENDVFMLEGYGPIRAADVMEYDRQGHLVWANDGTRAWVGARANKEGLVSTVPKVTASSVAHEAAGSEKDRHSVPTESPVDSACLSTPDVGGDALTHDPKMAPPQWWRKKYIIPAAVSMVIVVLAVVGFAWTVRAQNERKAAETAAAQKSAADHASMVKAVEPFLRLDAALDVGIVFADYTKLVQDVQYAAQSYAPEDATGRQVKDHLAKAAALYAAALDNWNSHIQYETPEAMQTSWAAASAEVGKASALAKAQP